MTSAFPCSAYSSQPPCVQQSKLSTYMGSKPSKAASHTRKPASGLGSFGRGGPVDGQDQVLEAELKAAHDAAAKATSGLDLLEAELRLQAQLAAIDDEALEDGTGGEGEDAADGDDDDGLDDPEMLQELEAELQARSSRWFHCPLCPEYLHSSSAGPPSVHWKCMRAKMHGDATHTPCPPMQQHTSIYICYYTVETTDTISHQLPVRITCTHAKALNAGTWQSSSLSSSLSHPAKCTGRPWVRNLLPALPAGFACHGSCQRRSAVEGAPAAAARCLATLRPAPSPCGCRIAGLGTRARRP